MKLLLAFVFALMLPGATLAADASQAAADAAKAWVALVDAGNYAKSWSEASKLFQERVAQAEWEKQVKPVREMLGSLVSRTPGGVELATTLPGAPDGHYAIVKFKTVFAKKAAATETVVMMQEGQAWKCAGYFIE